MKDQKRLKRQQTTEGEPIISTSIRVLEPLYNRIREKAYRENKSIALVTAELLEKALDQEGRKETNGNERK